MKGKIALEEHFAIDDTLQDSNGFLPDEIWTELSSRLLDIHGKRLKQMDEQGIEMMLLSLNAPAIQAIPDVKRANELAKKANDFLAEAGGNDVLTEASTSANRTATTATVTVTGFSLSVIPGWKVRITQSASVPVERLTAPNTSGTP